MGNDNIKPLPPREEKFYFLKDAVLSHDFDIPGHIIKHNKLDKDKATIYLKIIEDYRKDVINKVYHEISKSFQEEILNKMRNVEKKESKIIKSGYVFPKISNFSVSVSYDNKEKANYLSDYSLITNDMRYYLGEYAIKLEKEYGYDDYDIITEADYYFGMRETLKILDEIEIDNYKLSVRYCSKDEKISWKNLRYEIEVFKS